MWLPRGLSADGASVSCTCRGASITKGCPRKKTGDQEMAVAVFIFRHEFHSTFKRLPSNSDGRYTTGRALQRERVGPREPPAVGGASRVRVVSIHPRCRALSTGITCGGG